MQAKTTREKIIDDCLALIWRNGVNGTSMSDIADKAAILKGSFYNYFKSKEEFVSAVLDSYAAKWETNVVAIFREKKTNARAKFKALLDGAGVELQSSLAEVGKHIDALRFAPAAALLAELAGKQPRPE